MQTIDVHEAETHLGELVVAAAKGESFVIAVDGKEMVKVTAVNREDLPNGGLPPQFIYHGPTDLRFGTLAGTALLPEDFDRFGQEEILEMFGVNE